MSLGDRLKRQRLRRKLSQHGLAALSKVPQPLISMLEANAREHTTSKFVVALASVLGCTTDWLLCMDENEQQE
jgi:transcriptional regulator with XRE-family HTH domain